MTSYNSLLIPAVCKRCKANLASLSKRESTLDNDGNEGDNDGDNESHDHLELPSLLGIYSSLSERGKENFHHCPQ